MNTEQLIEYLALGEKDASDLLNELDPKIEKKFLKACKDLSKIVDEVRKKYPDANIYVQEDTPLLLLGDSHSKHTSINNGGDAQREMEACGSLDLIGKIDGGGW
ncbi:hypothetical protein [Acinetobacter bereziniae]|uniref:hypothetical protein n=1 Tax=Acinetobacter bereziniae TaxID=106648 RepID=UPI00124FD2B9|nr:hypothetical protein [Acinetobacter bereziniae]MCU4320609.1 hypothetical protein [Acinetobacter bereziniae]